MSFNSTRTKVQLKLAINRLKLLQVKKAAVNASARKDIASLLSQRKDASAFIRVENVIREDNAVEALEVVELYCELLLARFGLLEQSRTGQVDPTLAEAIATIIWAAPRCEAREVLALRDLLAPKIGREAALAAYENTDDVVNKRVSDKLDTLPPSPALVEAYLAEIANAYEVNWISPSALAIPGADELLKGTKDDLDDLKALESAAPVAVMVKPTVVIRDPPPPKADAEKEGESLNDLMSRLDALKR